MKTASPSVAGIEQVSENLFKVKFELIFEEISTSEIDRGNAIHFANPRNFSETFDTMPRGCSSQEMDDLKVSIQERGLLTPLIGRLKNNKVSLVNGHRRYKAIKLLIEQNELCYDNFSGKNIPAQELYLNIVMKVFESMNDMDCYLLAFEEDKTKVKFGAGAEYKFVQHCMENNIDDAKIIKMTGNNQLWLDNVKSILEKLEEDYEILDALFSNKMNLSAIKKIAQYETQEERNAVYKEALAQAEKEASHKKYKQERSIINTKKKIENVLADKIQASFSGDENAEKAADDLIQNYMEQEQKQQEALHSIDARVTGRNVHPADKGPKGKKIKQHKTVETTPSSNFADINDGLNLVVTDWLQKLESFKDKSDVSIDFFLIDFAKDLLEKLADKSTDCQQFMEKWDEVLETRGMVG